MSKKAIKRVNEIEESEAVEDSEAVESSEESNESEEVEESESGNEADEESDSAEESEPPMTVATKIEKPILPKERPRIKIPEVPTQIMVCGPTNSGKTNAVKQIIKSIAKKFQYIVVYCPTAKLNKDYDFLPKKYICDYSKEHLDGIMQRQADYVKKSKKVHCLIIFDDIVGSVETHHNKQFAQLATSSRHYNISLIYITQHAAAIDNKIRNNVPTVLATKLSPTEATTLYEKCKCMATKKEFFKILSEQVNPVPYQFICLQDEGYTLVKFPKTRCFKIKYKY